MKTRTFYILFAIVMVAGPALAGQPVIASIFAVGIAISWQVHALEVRVNKLLSSQGLTVWGDEVAK